MPRIATAIGVPLALSVWVVSGCAARPTETASASVALSGGTADAYVMPTSFPGPAAHVDDERRCGAHSPIVGTTVFTRFRLPRIRDREVLRYRALTAAACVRPVDDGFSPLIRRQRWLKGCLQRAELRDLIVDFRIAGDGQVRRIDVLRAEPRTSEVARCIQLATLLDFDARGCAWRRRFWTNGEPPPVLEI